ncbi:Clp protease N-terminal domain-containing protein [Kitasatospora sp. NPDC059327]|uniref:Clp protease N-terminal domain-containing protein n=1 Tax=Kitasatospora sp. NPDC059327 TaxID=3346803 RepID=UPI003674DEA7
MADDHAPTATPRYLTILDEAARIASELGHEYVGVEHLFLAILADPRAVPTQVLTDFVPPEQVTAALHELLSSPGYNTPTRNVVLPPE